MSFLGFILIGLVVGVIVQLLLPGKQSGGWMTTLTLSVVGAVLGGWVGALVFHLDHASFFSLTSWSTAVVGAALVLLIWSFFTRRTPGT